MKLFNFTRKRETKQKAVAGASVDGGLFERYTNRSNMIGAVYRAVDLRSRTFSQARLLIERNIGGAWLPIVSDVTGARDFRHLVYLFQVEPNEFMGANEMWRLAQWYRDTEGCAAIYVPGGFGVAHQVYPVHDLQLNYANNTYTFTSDHLRKTFSNVGREELILMKGVPSNNNLLGRSLVDLASVPTSLYRNADAFSIDSLSKGGIMKLFVRAEESVDPLKGMTNLNDKEEKKAFEDLQRQTSQNQDVIFTQGDLKVETRSQSFQDLQVDLHKNKAIEDVARYYGVPMPLMFSTTNAVYKSVDDAYHSFIGLTIAPLWAEVEQELNAIVLGEAYFGQMRFRFDYSHMCIDSDNTKAQASATRKNAGITTANEERKMLGLPPITGGDSLGTNNANTEGGES